MYSIVLLTSDSKKPKTYTLDSKREIFSAYSIFKIKVPFPQKYTIKQNIKFLSNKISTIKLHSTSKTYAHLLNSKDPVYTLEKLPSFNKDYLMKLYSVYSSQLH